MANSVPSFAQDIRPLFREMDREEMEYISDLWNYEDVRTHAQSILERVEDGTMPCDEEWPEDRIALFRSWIDAGMPA